MVTTKVDDNTLGVEETVLKEIGYDELVRLKELRQAELASAQANLDSVNFLLSECDKLGISSKEAKAKP